MKQRRETPASFEETYPRYPFAELVRLGLGLARWIATRRRKLGADRQCPEAKSLAGSPRRQDGGDAPEPGTIPPLPGTLLSIVWVLPL